MSASTGTMYHDGLNEWGGWASDDYVWLLMDSGYVPAIAQATIAEIAAAELTVSGYTRQPVTAPVMVDTYTYQQGLSYGCADPVWTGLGTGGDIGAIVLARVGASDATSPLVARWDGPFPGDAGDYTFGFGPWVDTYNDPLPGGDADTHLVHRHETHGL
jgi:hypothetical protein